MYPLYGHPSLYPSDKNVRLSSSKHQPHSALRAEANHGMWVTHTIRHSGIKASPSRDPRKPENAWDTLHLDQMAWGKETRHLYSPRFHTAKSSTNKNTHRQTSARWKTWKWELGSSSLKQFWARTMRAQPRWWQDSIAELMAHAASGGLGPPLSTHREQAEDSISNHQITCSQSRQPDQSTKNSRVGIQSQSS